MSDFSHTRDAPDALDMLKADHDNVKRLLRAVDTLGPSNGDHEADTRKAALIDDICYALTIHAMLEEEIIYPALRAAGHDDDLLDEAEGEHAGMRELVNQLEVLYPGDAHFTATLAVLADEFGHHVEKEESELFQAARRAGIDLLALGARMSVRRRALDADLTAPS